MDLLALIVAIAVAVALQRQNARLYRVERDNAALRAMVEALRAGVPVVAPAAPDTPAAAGEAPAEPMAEPVADPVADSTAAAAAMPKDVEPVAARRDLSGLETRLTGRWLVWIGGVALALGAAFLVQVSIESGVLSPGVRVSLGLALAMALVAAGEWLRRHPPSRGVGPVGAGHLPATVTGAGIAAAYASVYAAHGLYGLIAQTVAFAGLAGVSFAALVLALRHGPAIAALGIVGAYAVPAVVGGESDDGVALFTYLATVSTVAALTARWRGWNWAVPTVHWGGLLWIVAWLIGRPGSDPPWPAVLYLILTTALAVGLRRRPPLAEPVAAGGLWARLRDARGRIDGVGLSVAAATLLAALPAMLAGEGDLLATLVPAVVPAALLLVDDRAGARLTGGGVAAVLALLAAGLVLDTDDGGGLVYAVAAAAGLTGAAFVAAHGSPRAGWFSLVGGAGSLLLVAVGYLQHTGGEPDVDWALAAAVVAALHTAVAGYAGRLRDHPPWAAVLAGYATAALGGLAVGVSLLLRDAGLTVALAWTVAAAAAVHRSVPVAGLRTVALVLAAVVVVRLDLNPEALSYPLDGPIPGVPWIWFGYGLSALAFLAARAGFADAPAPTLRTLLESGALSFVVLLVSLQIRLVVDGGPLDRPGYDLLEQGLNSVWWLAVALLLYVRATPGAAPTARYGWRVLGAVGAAQVLAGAMVLDNPLWEHVPVGTTPLFNALLPAYALPALIGAGFVAVAIRRGTLWLSLGAAAASFAVAWIWLVLTVRQAFEGSYLTGADWSDGELYTHSLVWLVYGAVLLAVGLWRHALALRYASLLVVLVTVGKVFLVDMEALTGLWRAVSFLGLGAALIAIGYAYQRFVLVRPAPPSGT